MDATGIAVLRLLAAAPLTRRELASRVPGVELGRTVAELVRSRLVGRTVDPADRRRTLIAITPQGLARLGRVSKSVWVGWVGVGVGWACRWLG